MGSRKWYALCCPLPVTAHCPLLYECCYYSRRRQRQQFGGQTPKQFIEIAGAPIIIHTLRKFDECEDIGASSSLCGGKMSNGLSGRFAPTKSENRFASPRAAPSAAIRF